MTLLAPVNHLRGRRLAALAWAVTVITLATVPSAFAAPTPANVPVTDTAERGYQGPWLAVNPANSRQLAASFQEEPRNTCWLGLSGDGGATWRQVPLVGPASDHPLRTLPGGFVHCFRPSLTYGPDGTLYYAYTAGQAGFPGYNIVSLLTSTDDGKTFGAPVAIDTKPLPNSGNVNDQIPRMATDPKTGRLYVAWQQVTGRFTIEHVLVASLGHRGRTFSSPVQVDPPRDSSGPQVPSVGRDGRVYVTLAAFPAGTLSDQTQPELIQVVSSTDHGATFSAPVTAQREYQCFFHGPNACSGATSKYDGGENIAPELVPAPSGRDTYLVSYGLIDDTFRVQLSISHDAAKTWGTARTIGIPRGRAGDNQVLPTIAIAPNGRLDIVYYDLGPSLREDTYLISSSNGSNSFSTPELLSGAPSNTQDKPRGGFGNDPFSGSQLVASTNDKTYTAWTDSRRAVNPGKEDIFAAAVPLPPRCTARAASTQDLDRTRTLLSTVSCDQSVSLSERGRLVLRGVPHRARTRTYRLPVATQLAPGRPASVRMRLSRRLVAIIDSALRQHRRIAVSLTVTAKGAAGQHTVTLRISRLRIQAHRTARGRRRRS